MNLIKNKIFKNNVFIIAEIGSNHNQSFKRCIKLINTAKKCGANAVKLQFLNYERMYFSKEKKSLKNIFKKIELNENWISKLNRYCKKKKIIFFYSSCDTYGLDICVKNKISITKIASPQFYSFPELIRHSLNKKLFTFCSTGYSTFSEIKKIFLKYKLYNNNNIVLMHCLSKYPATVEDINIHYIKKLKKTFSVNVGYSDHTMSTVIPALAVMCGAQCIEKHLTLNRKAKGPDHSFALEPNEFKEMVINIRTTEKLIKNKNLIEKKDLKTRLQYNLKIFLNKNISCGKKIKKIFIYPLRTSKKGILYKDFSKIEHFKMLKKNKKKNEILEWKDLEKIS